MKKVVRLTEGDLHRIIRNSVKRILSEGHKVNIDGEEVELNGNDEKSWARVGNLRHRRQLSGDTSIKNARALYRDDRNMADVYNNKPHQYHPNMRTYMNRPGDLGYSENHPCSYHSIFTTKPNQNGEVLDDILDVRTDPFNTGKGRVDPVNYRYDKDGNPISCDNKTFMPQQLMKDKNVEDLYNLRTKGFDAYRKK